MTHKSIQPKWLVITQLVRKSHMDSGLSMYKRNHLVRLKNIKLNNFNIVIYVKSLKQVAMNLCSVLALWPGILS